MKRREFALGLGSVLALPQARARANRRLDGLSHRLRHGGAPYPETLVPAAIDRLQSPQPVQGGSVLLIAGIGFRRIWQQSPDFYLVSPLREGLGAPNRGLACLAIVAAMMILHVMRTSPDDSRPNSPARRPN